MQRKLPITSTPGKRLPTCRPKSILYANVKFLRPNKPPSIKVCKNDITSLRDLYIPHGSQIIDMTILSSVLALLRCTEKHCTGPLNLYQYSFRHGLQSYLLVKCSHCHLVIAEFPTYVPIWMKAHECINDPRMLDRSKKSEVNYRALLATHCTSLSWADFLPTCNILGVQNSWDHMPKASLSKLSETSGKFCKLSMSLTASRVYASAEMSTIPNTIPVGDGDSSSFKRLEDSDPCDGRELVRKEECLGHTQKRLKKRIKKPSTKAFTPKPIKTATKVEKIGHLYALVIVENRGRAPGEIQSALYTLVDHLEEKHSNCPFSTNSWCYFQKKLALIAEDASIPTPILRHPYLASDEMTRLKDVFQKFASIDMCSALALGMTQNSNESLHLVLWHNAPKGKRVGQKSLQTSAALAVCTFNEGSMILAAVLADLGVQSSHKNLAHFARMDRERNRCRIKTVVATVKRRRRLLKTRFLATEKSRKKKEIDSTYKSGAFGTEAISDSDTVCEECQLRECPVGRKTKKIDWLGCESCLKWFHSRCVDVNKKDFKDAPYICDDCDSRMDESNN